MIGLMEKYRPIVEGHSKNLNFFFLFIGLIISTFRPACSFQEDTFLDGQLTLLVEDCIGEDSVYSLRSSIHIRSVKSGNAVVTHTREWTEEYAKQLKNLAENDGFYKIRVQQKDSEDRGYISTFTKACLLYESGLSETLTIMLDNNGGSVVGVGLMTPVTVCQGTQDVSLLRTFNTTVITRSPIQAPVPDTATYIQKLEAMKTEKAEGRDNRSFLAKYWMYIVPVVLILLISGGGQEGGGR